MPAKTADNQIALTRIVNATVAQVWAAWNDIDQVSQWWGPRGFTITTKSKDVRAGGTWVYTMHGPDGTDYPNITQYLEVKEQALLVYDHGGNAHQPPMFRVRVEFFAVGSKTKMEFTMTWPTAEAAKSAQAFIKQANGNSTWDRLAEYLDKSVGGHEHFVINRSFDVPIETMFEVWTNPTHLAKWTGPAGMNIEFFEIDVRPGGRSYSKLSGANGTMYSKVEYLEVTKPTRLVYQQEFSDDQRGTTRHPMSPTWPLTMLTTIEFYSEGRNATRVTLTWAPAGHNTAEEIATFTGARTGMNQGWTGSFDKLEEYSTLLA